MDDAPKSRPSLLSNAPQSIRGRLNKRLQTFLRLRWLYLVRAEIRFAPTEAQRLFALTLVIGVVCGFAAVAFHLSIHFVSQQLIERATRAEGRSWIGWTIAVPTLGALLCGVLLERVFPNARGSGIPQVKAAFAAKSGRIRLRDSLGKFLVSTLQLGTGSSLGREGPTVQICAGLASTLGRYARISHKSMRRLIPVGAAAGIAAAFNAPIAAVTFTVEEVVGNLDQTMLSGAIVAAALAAVIERSVLGESPIFMIPDGLGLRHPSSLLVYALIGIAAAFASHLFTTTLLSTRARFARSKLPRWARPACGGLVTGLLAAGLLGMMNARGVTGGGYDTLGHALTGSLSVEVLLLLLGAKLIATVASYASGGAGGLFAPTLFIGGMLGGAIGSLDQTLLGHEAESAGAFALVGMGAVFAGVIRAPITSVLIIVEMTNGYSLILPLMIANMTAYLLARHWRPMPIYEALLEQDGVRLEAPVRPDLLDGISLDQLVNRSNGACCMSPSMRAEDVSRIWRQEPQHDAYPVLDAERHLVGVITENEIRILEREPDLLPIANASDLMQPPFWVRAEDDVRSALEAMVEHGVRTIPVVDEGLGFVGMFEETTIAELYRKQRLLRQRS